MYISLLTANRAFYIISWYTEWWVDHSFLEYMPTIIQTGMCAVTLVDQMIRCVVLLFARALRGTQMVVSHRPRRLPLHIGVV